MGAAVGSESCEVPVIPGDAGGDAPAISLDRLIDAADVIRVMVQIREDELREQKRASDLNLAPEELAFYDAVAANLATVYDEQFLAGLIHEVVLAVKRNLKVDWTEPHRDAVQAEVRAAVRRVLRARGKGGR